MFPLKIFFAGEIRRVSAQSDSWKELLLILQTIFGDRLYPSFLVQYVDSEGDLITVTTQIEWREALYLHFEEVVSLQIMENVSS